MEINNEPKNLYIKNETPVTDVQNIEQKLIEHIIDVCQKNGYILVEIKLEKV
jgi:hypothetical protein